MAETTIAIYGIRFEPKGDEIKALEDRTHPAIVRARKVGLQHYWGNFASPDERYLLFVGKLLGKFGVEDLGELHLTAEEFYRVAEDVKAKLSQAGYSETPGLIFQFQPDEREVSTTPTPC